MDLPRLLVSFSGGRSSALMAHLVKKHWSHLYDLRFVFANTSFEHHDTLRFVDAVDREFGLGVIWLEAVANHTERKASGHRVVNFQTAARDGEVFRDSVAKYGLPNRTFKSCTRELKLNAIKSYTRSIGWLDHLTAVGIRNDEPKRISPTAPQQRIIYPLATTWPTDKQDVLAFFEDFEWNLAIPEHMGNCRACFQKSDRKLAAVYRDDPAAFDFVAGLERDFSHIGPNNRPGPRKFFRLERSSADMRNAFDLAGGHVLPYDDEPGSCSESCEAYQNELDLEPV
ncbi:phosphoadenosine phosphosulfate reductase family protein [Achromobacter mucicolens]|uniref:Phosphoadenosine phosphosulphate reductase domain-containing protein n=1 Tax=Achromobacter mucicolens TaxID=1389922 RepID=A0ABM8LKP1_9BURK|nr:phosphoadenosine phosphosulfate reductase family protein [Achromobacter mucicolens]CAB3917525.1 hypothetical protein LMG3415_05322 [Achromobacter mucicolens]